MKEFPVVFEDDEIFIVNKPTGVAVQGGKGISHSLDKDFSTQVGMPVYLVHRLDKNTSGLMIVAKNPVSAAKWTKLISSGAVKKEYIAICVGKFKKKSGSIKTNINVNGKEKPAHTDFKVINECCIQSESGKNYLSKVVLTLHTGRMHQIRIHLAGLGYPIAGDDKHGNFTLNKILKKDLKIKHLLLCAAKISVTFSSGERVFEIPLPDYMDFF